MTEGTTTTAEREAMLSIASCDECWFSKPHNNGIPAQSGTKVICRRSPAYVERGTGDWCGEFVGRIEMKSHLKESTHE